MISTSTVLIALMLPGLSAYLPSPHDKDGIGLRIHNLSVRRPYIGEYIGHVRFDVTLLNHSKKTWAHDPLSVARSTGSLQLRITQPNGRNFSPQFSNYRRPRDPFTVQLKLQPGEFSSLDFQFTQFGYIGLGKPGRYRMEATFKLDGKTVASPPIELEVVAVPKEAVLVNYLVPLEGIAATKPPAEQERRLVQQVKVGNRTLLIYNRRLAELPGKVEMTVEGAYGAGNPLTIKYKDAKTKTGWTTLVINSISGSPWTEEEEQHRQERLREKNGLPPLAPPPRPAKP